MELVVYFFCSIHGAGRMQKRSVAASLFSAVLALKSKERIDLLQKRGPYSEIMIVKRVSFFFFFRLRSRLRFKSFFNFFFYHP